MLFDCCCDERCEDELELVPVNDIFGAQSSIKMKQRQPPTFGLFCEEDDDEDVLPVFPKGSSRGSPSSTRSPLSGSPSPRSSGSSEAPEGARRFEVSLQRRGRLGLSLEEKHDVGLVCVVIAEDGCVHKYNESAPAGRRVAPHDILLAVNGSRSTAAMMHELLHGTAGTLRLGVLRPLSFTVALNKGSSKLGADIVYQKEGRSIDIRGLGPGVIASYNERAPPEKVVRAGDWIAKVNGTSGPAEELLLLLSRSRECVLTLMRRP